MHTHQRRVLWPAIRDFSTAISESPGFHQVMRLVAVRRTDDETLVAIVERGGTSSSLVRSHSSIDQQPRETDDHTPKVPCFRSSTHCGAVE